MNKTVNNIRYILVSDNNEMFIKSIEVSPEFTHNITDATGWYKQEPAQDIANRINAKFEKDGYTTRVRVLRMEVNINISEI